MSKVPGNLFRHSFLPSNSKSKLIPNLSSERFGDCQTLLSNGNIKFILASYMHNSRDSLLRFPFPMASSNPAPEAPRNLSRHSFPPSNSKPKLTPNLFFERLGDCQTLLSDGNIITNLSLRPLYMYNSRSSIPRLLLPMVMSNPIPEVHVQGSWQSVPPQLSTS